jgi:hypothetical protein
MGVFQFWPGLAQIRGWSSGVCHMVRDPCRIPNARLPSLESRSQLSRGCRSRACGSWQPVPVEKRKLPTNGALKHRLGCPGFFTRRPLANKKRSRESGGLALGIAAYIDRQRVLPWLERTRNMDFGPRVGRWLDSVEDMPFRNLSKTLLTILGARRFNW